MKTDMAFKIFISFASLALGFLVLVMQPSPAYSSSRGTTTLEAVPPLKGMCESAVTIHGYKCQEYEVTTKDGYILSMQRMPEGRLGDGGVKNKQPVLLQHGVLVDGMAWLLNSPDESLAFILADSGFDVWIASTRGTRYSRKHATIDPANAREYWDWSWDELAEYDLPATLDFVYAQTGQQINYVGHSMGTLVALASLSQGKMTNLKSIALLSPVAYLSHMTTAIGKLAAKAFVGEITTWLGISEFNPKEKTVINFLNTLCAHPEIDCYDLMSSVTGKNCCLNASTVDLFLQNEPQSTSTKNMVHLAQTARGRVLSKFDYGKAANMQCYGQGRPPVYDLTNIPVDLPIFITYGGRDALADVQDVLLLLDSLKLHQGDKLTVQYVKDYAHADFIMGVTAKEIVYNAMALFFKRQSRQSSKVVCLLRQMF